MTGDFPEHLGRFPKGQYVRPAAFSMPHKCPDAPAFDRDVFSIISQSRKNLLAPAKSALFVVALGE
jgi:hypothetical protein